MQQQQGGGSQSQYRLSTEIPHFAAPRTGQMLGGATVSTDNINNSAHHQQAEEASPISSRPPASSNFEELIVPVGHGGGGDDDVLGASDEMDRGGISGGNRWPRQETLALLKIRSEMDVTFRDASLKGPLWEEVSRKLAELGYTRNAKKCKEKFENVHKYYKRTKEGRAGRQDGKSYRFFSQLEALHGTTTTTAIPTSAYASPPAAATTTASPLFVKPVSIGISNPMPVQIPPPSSSQSQAHQIMGGASQIGIISPPSISTTAATTTAATTSTPAVGTSLGISFSSDSYSTSSSASEDEEEDDEDDVELPVELGGSSSKYVPDSSMGRGQKRKRGGGGSGGGSGSRRLMGFLESLMKQVMQKQEAMQQRFLETIEKREKDRMIREEAWKRQEMTRLSREHELMAQERAIAASRDSAIISFLQKITGQTIQFPTTTPITTTFTVPIATPPPMPTPSATIQPPPPPPPQQQQQPHHQQRQQTRHQLHQAQKAEEVTRHQQPPLLPPPPVSSEIVMAVPEQQVAPVVQQETSGGGGGGSGSYDPTSSRWPKTEVNVLIQLRSESEAKYQEAGPKGPLWEEISARMQRMGYKRNAKRCKEKWENINKYFKKVKESNKKRPEDAKTCPYFHQLDALYRKKSLAGSTSGAGSTSFGNQNLPEQPQQQQIIALDPTITAAPPQLLSAQATESASDNKVDNSADLQATLFREGSSSAGGGPVKPEDIVKELIEQQQQQRKPSLMHDYDKVEELDSDNLDLDEDDEEEEEEEESEEDTKMAYKIEFQRQNNAGGSASNRGGNGGAPSFVTMVQ